MFSTIFTAVLAFAALIFLVGVLDGFGYGNKILSTGLIFLIILFSAASAVFLVGSWLGAPMEERNLQLNSVYEVVQFHDDGLRGHYAIIRIPDGPLVFVRTKKQLENGFYKFETITNAWGQKENAMVPFSTSAPPPTAPAPTTAPTATTISTTQPEKP